MATKNIKYIPPTKGVVGFKQHYYYLRCAADLFNASATLDVASSRIKLNYLHSSCTLFPQFIKSNSDGTRFYNALFEKISDHFAGWRPYLPTIIDPFKDKLTLKKRLLDEGCLAPDHSESVNAALANVIVKNRFSSFSQNIKGPFYSTDEYRLEPERGEYYEQFIPGKIAKIWYMNQQPICMDLATMPYVVGDGRRHIGDLLIALSASKGYENPQDALLKQVIRDEARYKHDGHYQEALTTLHNIQHVLALYGKTMHSVLDTGQQQIFEFRYFHRFPRDNATYWLDRCEWDVSPYRDQLQHVGDIMSAILSEECCDLLFYTVDAILDNNKRLWILEANSNPVMHPFIYEDMVRCLSENS